MSRESEKVKSWRRRTKQRIVDSLGGECYICGYKKCVKALEPHHLNPEEKTFALGGVRANPVTWVRIVEELRKCVLLCSNCHREVEDGMTELNLTKSTFNEAYVEYEPIRAAGLHARITLERLCAHCNGEINAYNQNQKFCNEGCSNEFKRKKKENRPKKSRPRKVNWPDRAELVDLLRTMSWSAIGRKYGVSDNAVRKWAKSYGLL